MADGKGENASSFGWGIWSTGTIASAFARELDHVPFARKAAVCSRSTDGATAFAKANGVERCYDDAEAFLADPGVDIVYIASPHPMHHEHALRAIAAGKAVLIEKPIAMTAAEARAIAAAAHQAGVFVMEALWTRFLPAVRHAKALLEEGAIGTVRKAEASLQYHRPFDAEHRLFNPALGGGVLLDLGVYPLSVTSYLLGAPELVDAAWVAGPTGVDVEAQLSVTFGGVPTSIAVGFMQTPEQEGENCIVLYGDKATLRIDRHFLNTKSLTLWDVARDSVTSSKALSEKIAKRLSIPDRKRVDFPRSTIGLNFQAAAVQAALARGDTSHPIMPMAESATVLDIIEQVLARSPDRTHTLA